ncbi:hypothetical protein QLQ12_26630 [Actinoplanes sp. NEAU-A12]|uniref:Uncharacterized protein n=1 Tax=Actinoplanes sandaracinus TaxID=3045177 RepID=A0ABT6WR34_9ACTN|nr:hypothetical protein [Actinoplanes sandaracinus]MDI6102198.1 hypothetical protein [Actinoplanes sandaracinus]
MSTAKIGRRTAAGAIVLALGTGLAATPHGPAHAGGFAPARIAETTDNDDSTTKTVTATCTRGSVFAAGARIVDGSGGVALTSMAPDPGLNSVTVTAAARSGHTGDWALTAYATCAFSARAPLWVSATVPSGSTAEVDCPGITKVVGTGFRVEGPVDHTYVDEVAFGAGLNGVRVHAGGEPDELTAFAICKEPTPLTGPPGVRVQAASAGDTWPRTAVTGGSGPDQHVYAVGARVVSSGAAFLSVLAPGPDSHLAHAEAVQAGPLPGAPATARTGEDDASLTVSGLLMGAFH